MTQSATSSDPLNASLSEGAIRESFYASINQKIVFHRLATFADLPKTSSFKTKSVNLFTSGYYFKLLDNMINCSHCGYSFDANGVHDTEKHRRKNMRCPGLGNTGFISFRALPRQFQDPVMNELFQNEEFLFNNARAPDIADSYTANVEEAERVDFETLTSVQDDAGHEYADRGEYQKQLEKFNELYHFNEAQIQILFILGMFFSDDCIKCSECSFKVNWDMSFFKLINSHYAMFPGCNSRKVPKVNQQNVSSFLLARSISICLPTFVNPTKKVDQSRSIMFAGAGFAFQWRNEMMYCYWCNFVAPENVENLSIEALFVLHFEKRTCPFVKKFIGKPMSVDETPEVSKTFLKAYIQMLLMIASIEGSQIATESKSNKGAALKLLDPPMAYHNFDFVQTGQPSLSMGVSLSNISPNSNSSSFDPSETVSAPHVYQQMKYLSERERIHPNLRSIPSINREEHTFSSGPAFIGTCVICLASAADQVFVGCGHVATCKDCSIQVNACPICRTRVTGIVPVRGTVPVRSPGVT